ICGRVRQADANQSACAFRVVSNTVATITVVDRNRLLVVIGCLCICGPAPTIAANLAGVGEVIQKSKRHRQAVMVRRDSLRVLGQCRITVAARQIAKNLIVGLVLLNDVDDVFYFAPQKSSSWRRGAGSPCHYYHRPAARELPGTECSVRE